EGSRSRHSRSHQSARRGSGAGQVDPGHGGQMTRAGWRPAFLMLAAALAAGCGRPPLYSWGQYQELIYRSSPAPRAVSPAVQIEKLEADYQKARSENKPVPPGFHAHLGFLYFQLGKLDQAQQQLETEKAQFPESAVFMDRLLSNLRKN